MADHIHLVIRRNKI